MNIRLGGSRGTPCERSKSGSVGDDSRYSFAQAFALGILELVCDFVPDIEAYGGADVSATAVAIVYPREVMVKVQENNTVAAAIAEARSASAEAETSLFLCEYLRPISVAPEQRS